MELSSAKEVGAAAHATLPRMGVRGVTVEYPGVRALDNVTVDFMAGEIHAIVGENGAGKSTLMKVLSGALAPNAGDVLRNGEPTTLRGPRAAIRAGISMVHQELNLVATLSVAENVLLGREPTFLAGIAVDRPQQRERARALLAMLGAEMDLDCAVSELSIADCQYVEIAKCLASEAQVLILDEPTAVLGEHEASKLLQLLRRLRDEGRAVLFISHHLDEVVAVADRVSVLRDGRLVARFQRNALGVLQAEDGAAATEDTLAQAMVGRELGSIYPPKGSAKSDATAAIELIQFGAADRSRDVSVTVFPGEIVGIAGLVGSGRTETAEAIVGLRRPVGKIRVAGDERTFKDPRAAMRHGVTYVSEDRKGRGLHVSLSSIANMTLPSLDAFSQFGGARIDAVAERSVVARWIKELAIRCARPGLPISSLSGGNQQKFALARWLETRPNVLIIDEPTRGVDIGAKAEIYRIIAALAHEGLACIVISSELPELIGLAHRVLVMRQGSVAGEVTRAQLAEPGCEERIVRIASGLRAERQEIHE